MGQGFIIFLLSLRLELLINQLIFNMNKKLYTPPVAEDLIVDAMSAFLYVSAPNIGNGGEEDW